MRKFALLAIFLVGLMVGGLWGARDALLLRLLPLVASRYGVTLQVKGLHLNLMPLNLSFGEMEASWQGGRALLERGNIRLSFPLLSVKGVALGRGRVWITLSPSSEGGGKGGLFVPPALEFLRVARLDLGLRAPWGRVDVEGARVVMGPSRYLLEGRLLVEARQGSLAGPFSFSGERSSLVAARPQGGGWWDVLLVSGKKKIKGRLAVASLTLDPKGPFLKGEGLSLSLPGLLDLRGRFSFERGKGRLAAHGEVVSLGEVRRIYPGMPRGLDGHIRFLGEVQWDGTLGYSVKVEEGRVVVRGLDRVEEASLTLAGELRGRGGQGELSLEPVSLDSFRLSWGEASKWRGQVKVRWRGWGKGGAEALVSLTRKGMVLQGKALLPGGGLEDARLDLRFRGVPGSWLVKWGALRTLPLDGGVKGVFQGEAAAFCSGGKWSLRGKLEGRGISFTTPGGNGTEDLGMRVEVETEDLVSGPWRVSLDLSKGQALYSYWFFDFGHLPWSLDLLVSRTGDRVCLDRVSYNGMARVDFKGHFCWPGGGGGRIELKGKAGNLYSRLVAEPLGEDEPFLKKVEPWGDLEARGSISLEKGLEVRGVASLRGGVKAPGWSVEGEAAVPVVYSARGQEEGRLDVSTLVLGPVTLKGWRSPLKGTPFMLRALEGYRVGLWHGRVEWGPFQLDYREPRNPRLEMEGVYVRDVRPPGLPLPVVVDARFSKVEGSREGVFFRGYVRVKVAKGEVDISRIRILYPFSDLMKVGCDVEFRHLDLEDLTRVTPFGRITGYIKGYIKDLVISHGQPESFRMRVETQEVKGVKKRISLEAINSISILGGGGPVSLFLPFFKSFGYSYLGFSCSLKNDVFTLHGLRKKGEYEYIVEKGGLTGVDVINRNPHNRISFRDMVERLERIRRGSHGEKG